MTLNGWDTIYRVSYCCGIAGILVSFATTTLVFIASNKISADLTNRLTIATNTVGAASERAGQAIERAAVLEKEAEQARLDLARLAMPQTVTYKQRMALKNSLAASPRGHVVVIGDFGSTEARAFPEKISDFLTEEGYNTSETPQKTKTLSIGNLGTIILVRDRSDPPAAALPIQSAFTSVGIDIPAYSKPDMEPPDTIWISVGPKS